jgi:6-phosphogluconolactonase
VVLFGMGDDAHTASIFPGAADLLVALNAQTAYVPFNATGCAVAGKWTQRITLTPHGWRDAARRLLLIRGESKRRVFEDAVASGNAHRFPVLATIMPDSAPLEVFWCP